MYKGHALFPMADANTPESAGERGRRKEQGVAGLGLGALVPHADEVEAAREHAALKAEEEARGQDARFWVGPCSKGDDGGKPGGEREGEGGEKRFIRMLEGSRRGRRARRRWSGPC